MAKTECPGLPRSCCSSDSYLLMRVAFQYRSLHLQHLKMVIFSNYVSSAARSWGLQATSYKLHTLKLDLQKSRGHVWAHHEAQLMHAQCIAADGSGTSRSQSHSYQQAYWLTHCLHQDGPAPSHAAGQTSNARSHAGSPVSTRRGSRVESPPNAANSGQVRDQYPGFKQECNCQIWRTYLHPHCICIHHLRMIASSSCILISSLDKRQVCRWGTGSCCHMSVMSCNAIDLEDQLALA